MAAWHQPIHIIRRICVPSPFRVNEPVDLPAGSPYGLRPSLPIDGWFSLLRYSITQASFPWYRNINLFPITYAFRPRLRGRLTQGGRTFPWKPWDFGGRDSHPTFRYSCPHNHFCTVAGRSPFRFNPVQNATLPRTQKCASAASAACLVPIIFGAESLD